MGTYKEEKRKVKKCKYERKKQESEQFLGKMNQDVGWNRKFFKKEVGNENNLKVERCSWIKEGSGKLVVRENEVQRTRKYYFVDLCDGDTEEQLIILMCGFVGFHWGNYFGEESVRRTWADVTAGKLWFGRLDSKDEVIREMKKQRGEGLVND